MSMKLRLLGVRGSRPTHKRSLLGYGGNSTSFELVVDHDFHLFIDGGSGLVNRGKEIGAMQQKNGKFYFLVTHTHWDHILGLPFFEPFYNDKNSFLFYASKTSRANFNELFFGLHRTGNLPIPVSELKAAVRFQTISPGEPFMIEDKVKVTTYQLNHQGVTLGYKVQDGKDCVCIITDNAPIENGNYLGEDMHAKAKGDQKSYEEAFNKGMVEFLKGAHTVVFDTHFTEENLKADWGHSTPQRALKFCSQAGVHRLVLFHHAPEDNDDRVDDKVQSILSAASQHDVEVVAAKEGDIWELRSA